jgi:diguanylate cyclase (GGDEF)-like protein
VSICLPKRLSVSLVAQFALLLCASPASAADLGVPGVSPSAGLSSEVLAALGSAMLAALAFAYAWIRERRRSRHARAEAFVDPLTGIANRLAFEDRLSHEWRRARRYERPLGLLMLDLDDLKGINDTAGHAAGDRTLKAVAEAISTEIRHSDLAARLAGDEFVVLCPETVAEGLKQTAAKLWEKLETRDIGVSIGRAEFQPEDESPEDLVARADVAMYRHKQRRRAVLEGAERRRRRLASQQPTTAQRDLATPKLSAPRAF